VYNLSKRTALYGTYAQVKNKGASGLTVGSQGVGSAAGGKSQGVEAGLRHSF
jgi:predicted porin